MINVKFYDFSFAKIDTSKDILNSLKKKFSYFEQGYMYAYSYIKGYWDGKTSLINKDLIPTGLLKPLFIYCRDNNLPIKIDISPSPNLANEHFSHLSFFNVSFPLKTLNSCFLIYFLLINDGNKKFSNPINFQNILFFI